jgi:hypothetical protein
MSYQSLNIIPGTNAAGRTSCKYSDIISSSGTVFVGFSALHVNAIRTTSNVNTATLDKVAELFAKLVTPKLRKQLFSTTIEGFHCELIGGLILTQTNKNSLTVLFSLKFGQTIIKVNVSVSTNGVIRFVVFKDKGFHKSSKQFSSFANAINDVFGQNTAMYNAEEAVDKLAISDDFTVLVEGRRIVSTFTLSNYLKYDSMNIENDILPILKELGKNKDLSFQDSKTKSLLTIEDIRKVVNTDEFYEIIGSTSEKFIALQKAIMEEKEVKKLITIDMSVNGKAGLTSTVIIKKEQNESIFVIYQVQNRFNEVMGEWQATFLVSFDRKQRPVEFNNQDEALKCILQIKAQISEQESETLLQVKDAPVIEVPEDEVA